MIASKIFFAVCILLFCSHQIFAQSLNFEFNKISEIRNGYTLQSNASPQQLWIDPQNPELLHAVFMNSQFKTDYPDRTCLYFGSTDFGTSWLQLGSVPDTSRSGFPDIYGTADGAAIIVNHSDYFGSPTRTGLFIDNSPFAYNFSAYDPGLQPATLWPKCIMVPDGDIWIASLSQMGDSLALNSFDPDSSTFSGWGVGETSNPEAYKFSVSNNGKIGFAFIGGEGLNEGDVIYLETTNGGITWSPPIKVFDCPAEQGIAVGAMRGIGLSYYGELPCVVFETCQQDFSQWGGIYYPRVPNQILFWSPDINGGVSKVIADSSNVPFAPSLNPLDVFPPLCRPVIGRSDFDDFLCVAFSAATENVYVGTDSISYFAGYFLYSWNGGNTWVGAPQKITPDFPLLDWKYISIAPINPWSGNNLFVHLVLQADSLEAVPNPLFLSAQYYHSMAWIMSIGVDEDLPNVTDFYLSQNYPNPFNPTTKIKYTIPSVGTSFMKFVQLKVYDVLGNEIATLVNEDKPAGSYQVSFDAGRLPSGVYLYTLRTGEFVQTRKMILLK